MGEIGVGPILENKRLRFARSGLAILAILANGTLLSALENRVANTSLSVPLEAQVFGYQTQNALGDLRFARPVAVATQPGRSDRIFVVEQAGRIYVIETGENPSKHLFLDIRDIVDYTDNEEGLLGMAFHPNWESNGYFYLFYTTETTIGGQAGRFDRLARFEIDPENSLRALPESERALISQFDQQWNHNGGDLHFGPDGYLYASLGDEGGGGDTYNNSRFIDKDFYSAIMRIDVDRLPGSLEPNDHEAIHLDSGNRAYYGIPPDNPFIGATQFNGQSINSNALRTEFWAVGLRNPWRFSFDSASGLIYCGDVGQNRYEEVDIIVKGGDYGWRLREGLHAFNNNSVPEGVELIDPILEYPQSNGPNVPGGKAEGKSVTGGVVYNGNRFAQLKGFYVFADYVSNRLFMLRYNEQTGEAEQFQQIATVDSPVSFGIDPSNGDVLIVRLNGTVERLIYSDTPVSGEALPESLSATGAFGDLAQLTPEPGIEPYSINVPFWSDYAEKSRWFSIPDVNDSMNFDETGNWTFPTGTVWIKHFELEITEGDPESRRRLETRFIVKNDEGVHGFTYRWNGDQSDTVLVAEEGMDEVVDIFDSEGALLRQQTWRYPARSECLQCHTSQGGYAAGFNTAQLNRDHDYGNGNLNQLEALAQVGYFDGAIPNSETLMRLLPSEALEFSLETRARSYLQANCVSCHQPGGTGQSLWDARIATPLEDAAIINGELLNDEGDPSYRIVFPGDLDRSALLQRISTRGQGAMPPLASSEIDQAGIDLLSEWILSLSSSIQATIETASEHEIGIRIVGEPNQLYRIEHSKDLIHWENLGEATTDENGETLFESTLDESLGVRYFRIR